MVPALFKSYFEEDMDMPQFGYDNKSYYKLIVDAKSKETKKVPLGNVPYLESLNGMWSLAPSTIICVLIIKRQLFVKWFPNGSSAMNATS